MVMVLPESISWFEAVRKLNTVLLLDTFHFCWFWEVYALNEEKRVVQVRHNCASVTKNRISWYNKADCTLHCVICVCVSGYW